MPRDTKILFEDDHIIVIEKPPGLLTIASEREKRHTAYAFLFRHVKNRRASEKLFIVHRLDREASGLVVFAKTPAAKHDLQQQFKERSAGRTYVAITEGRIARERQTIQSYLAENRIHRCYSTSNSTSGKWAVTHVNVLKRSSHRTLVEVRLETGRKHQIRVHLAERGHPIVGDRAYGSRSNPIRRMALHATKLDFTHPFTGQLMQFYSPPPPFFSALL